MSYFQKVIHEEEKQRPPKTYGKLRTWCFSKCIPPPPAHELLVVNEKATRQLQEHTKRVEQPARGTCELSGFGMVLSPGRVPETPPPLPGVPPPPSRPAVTGGAGLTFVSLTFWSLREEGTSPSSKSSGKKTERERQMKAGPEPGRKEQAWGARVVRGRRGRALGRQVSRAAPAATRGKEKETRKGSPGR